MLPDQKLSVGVVVLCAKSDELGPILQVISQTNFKKIPKPKNASFREFVIEADDGRRERLLVGCCRDMGNMYAAAQTGFIIGTNRPNLVIFVGTAAALDSEKCEIGDVVIPRNCEARFYNKVSGKTTSQYKAKMKEEEFREYFFTDKHPKTGASFETVLTWEKRQAQLTQPAEILYASFMNNQNLVAANLIKHDSADRNPKIHFDCQIFSSEWVIDAASYKKFLAREFGRKALAADMESLGFMETVEHFHNNSDQVTNGILIRGISDSGEAKEHHFDSKTALTNAAICAASFIALTYLSE